MKFSALAMLYAAHVIRGLRTIDSVPSVIREQVREIVEAESTE
ncbi:CD1375 family protein [Alkalicoccobacillus plakortidis]|nr:CD1375 family protein [Alkalicoccobacillus plakortidis]